MTNDLAWLATWHGDFDSATLLNGERWERYRGGVTHPTTLFTAVEIETARHNAIHTRWGQALCAALLAETEALGTVDEAWAARYVPTVMPYSPHFTMCPRCEFARMHGAYHWSPAEPEQIRCRGCGTVYPNADYPEELTFASRHDPTQVITLYGGKSWPAYGYAAIHSSFSGHARVHQCRYAANAAEKLALAYAVTGDARYARGAATILRRFAQVHPHYLVHSAYGDIADMDPKVAATNVNHLPEDEWCPPGNVPDRKLYPGYWMVMRWGSSAGMEGTSLHKLILAYDLVASTLDDTDRRLIEHDLLLDAAPLFFADPTINNKTGMNRSAVALIGIVCGDPLLVRFGLDGFVRAVRDWWLPDGGTPESLGYSSMMLHGVWRVAEAMRHYRDPDDLDLPPTRLDYLDLYQWPRYRAVWQGMARALLPDLEYPMLADNRRPCHLSTLLATVLARAYPTPRHQALRDAIQQIPRCYAGRIAQFWYGAHLESAPLFYRDDAAAPDERESALAFAGDLGPHLNIGTLRTGRAGRQSAIILSAADWKGHHHYDHLNLYYWRDGRELLTDLGYLWDMEDVGGKVRRTFAHHLALVDESEQRSKGRQGEFHLFHSSQESDAPFLAAMEASSNVYETATTYRRTVVVLGEGDDEVLVDIFRVAGGSTHDWVTHGPHNGVEIEGLELAAHEDPLYDLRDLRYATSEEAWVARWQSADGAPFCVHVPAYAGEQIYMGQGFGQRAAVDRGATVPYVLRRRTQGASVFVTVYSLGECVRHVRVAHMDTATLDVVVQIDTTQGMNTVLSLGPESGALAAEIDGVTVACDGRLAAITPAGATLVGGTILSVSELTGASHSLAQPLAALGGNVQQSFVHSGESGLVTNGDAALLAQLVGKWICVTVTGESPRARWYPVQAVEPRAEGAVLITRRENEGYDIDLDQPAGASWRAYLACSSRTFTSETAGMSTLPNSLFPM